jgi:NitT/TauT family transport system ATP-binding protein
VQTIAQKVQQAPDMGEYGVNAEAAPVIADAKPRIEIEGVGKRYGDLQVFQDIDLTFGEREIVTVVGPSGCGKTTLLRCICGLLPINKGAVRIDGVEVTEPLPGVAMVFQHFGLFPWKTVAQNVGYGLQMAGVEKKIITDKVPRYINLVGLTGFEDSYPHQLSGGMQQRCGLARALATEPSVLLMDEPFAAIDAQTREILQFELLRIWESRPTTMVFVTHSIDEAVLMGDRVVVLKGRPSSVFEVIDVGLPHPRNRDTLSSPRFAEVREHVWSNLMDEARAAEFETQ